MPALALVLPLAALASVPPGPGDGFRRCTPIDIDASGITAGDRYVVPIRLIDASDDPVEGPVGPDFQLVDASGIPLAHEVEGGPLFGFGVVWVLTPPLTASAPVRIWLRSDWVGGSPPAPLSPWNPYDWEGVWHFPLLGCVGLCENSVSQSALSLRTFASSGPGVAWKGAQVGWVTPVYIDLGATFAPPFTLSAWMRPGRGNPGERLLWGDSFAISKCSNDVDQICFLDVTTSIEQPTGLDVPELNGWHHLALHVEDQGAFREFTVGFDGEWASTTLRLNSPPSPLVPELKIGEGPAPLDQDDYSGDVDEVRIYRHLPSPEELRVEHALVAEDRVSIGETVPCDPDGTTLSTGTDGTGSTTGTEDGGWTEDSGGPIGGPFRLVGGQCGCDSGERAPWSGGLLAAAFAAIARRSRERRAIARHP